jgi:hypothetical protein
MEGKLQKAAVVGLGNLLLTEASLWMSTRSTKVLFASLTNVCAAATSNAPGDDEDNSSSLIYHVLANCHVVQIYMEAIYLGCSFNCLNATFGDIRFTQELFQVCGG